MESKSNKIINNFVSQDEIDSIILYTNSIVNNTFINNTHISHVAKGLNGSSHMFDVTNTSISNYLSKYQSSDNICNLELHSVFYTILDRISNTLNISSDHVFLQIVDMNKGGLITPHYDSSIDGYINFKCNISILSEDYTLYIDKDSINVTSGDLYTFEASLYKHWTKEFNNRRILLSYGFALKYEELGRSENDPRVRLSKRINSYFQ